MEASKLLTSENFDTIKKFTKSVFNKMEFQIKSFNETAGLNQSSYDEKITDCFIKEFQEVLLVVKRYLGANAYDKMVSVGREQSSYFSNSASLSLEEEFKQPSTDVSREMDSNNRMQNDVSNLLRNLDLSEIGLNN